MSRHRVKNVAYDDDDYDEDEYGEEEELSPEDREQMRLRTAEVRELLGSELPPVPASDEEIWESLWHYYYDVDKTVQYLRKKNSPEKTAKKQQNVAQAKQTKAKRNGLPTSYPRPTYSSTCSSPFSAADFFKDSPWLNVPAHRKADILIEPLYPRLGLLGGAPEGTGKMSKLAALAAARKKKEAEKQAGSASGEQSSNETTPSPPGEEQRSKSVSLLDRLAVNGKSQVLPERRGVKLPLRKGGNIPERTQQKPTTGVKEHENAPIPGSTKVTEDASTSGPVKSSTAAPSINLRAEPSTFATTIIGGKDSNGYAQPSHISQSINVMSLFGQDDTEAFNFAEPSPDDVVLNAQSAAKGNKNKRPAAKAADVSDGVKQLSVQEPVKVKSKNLDVLAEYRKAKRKKAANFVVIGHVDAGKSTLMGRLLLELEAVDQRTMEKYKREADRIGKGSFALAWVLDQGSEERERGVTIDIATNKFETEETAFTILDAPGHRDFVPNMIAGASQADFAVLVIDASTGNFESGLKGQTKEHALLVRSLGVQKLVVAVNKMDSTGWSKDRFDEIEQQISAFLTTAGFQPKNISFVPCSGLQGDNILKRSEAKESQWYTGRTLIEELETSEPYSYALEKPLRMTIADVFRGGVQNPLSISGRLDAGSLQTGDKIVTMPSGESATIKGVEVDQEPSDWAVAGQNVVLHLTDIDPIHLRSGDIICSPTSPIQNITTFTAKVLAFDHLTPMHIDVHRGRLHVPGRIARLVATLDKGSGAPVKKKPKIVPPGSVARIVVEMEQSIPLEAPGRVVLRASGETVAAGLLE